MNHPEDLRIASLYHDEQHSYGRTPQVISTLVMLVAGYLLVSFFDVWPSTTKRTIYELAIRLTPSPFIYYLQLVMTRLGRLPSQEAAFVRDDFGQFKAKEEAIRRMISSTSIPNVLQRARTISGYSKLLPATKEVGPPGLGNWDNSCYQNSILQGLASLPAFQHYIHRSLLLSERTQTCADTTAALTSFLDQLSDASCHQQTIWTPKILKSMDSWQQQDAQEYYSRILEALEKETMKYTNIVYRGTNLGLTGLRPDESVNDMNKVKAARKLLRTLVAHPMDGMFAQALTCQTCGFSEGISLTQFNCLTVNLGLGGSRAIEDLMDEYTEAELIDGVECDNCTRIALKKDGVNEEVMPEERGKQTEKPSATKELRVKAKQITFGRLPKNLVIHINRSIWDNYGNQVKNPSFVYFQPRLTFLKRWCALSEPVSNPTRVVYELKCIVTHSGRHDNGHYVAYAKRDKDWYCFNDEIVTAMSEQQVLTRGNVFMLFYEELQLDETLADESEVARLTEMKVEDISETASSTSAELEAQEEPVNNISQPVLPIMRTAGTIDTHDDSVGTVTRPFVPAI